MSKEIKKDNKRRNRSRNNGSGRRGKETEINIKDSQINKEDLKGADNDISWYSHYPTLLQNVTGVNFGSALGSLFDWGRRKSIDATGDGSQTPVTLQDVIGSAPGVMAIHYMPTLGAAGEFYDSVLNKVAVQYYSAMRMKLGSNARYEPVDTPMYLGAMDSAFTMYALGVRIYGCLRLASPFNYYYFRGLSQALNFDFDSFFDNMSNFRDQLNEFAIYLSSLEVPADFDLYKRHVWMVSNLFTDSSTAKAQLYAYVPDGYYVFTSKTTNEGAYLKAMPMPANMTYTQYMTIMSNILNSLLGDSDITEMSADTGKAFDHNVYVMNQIAEDYLTPVSFSQEVLTQFENCILCGFATITADPTHAGHNYWDIWQDNSATQTNPKIVQTPRTAIYTNNTASTATDKANMYAAMMGKKLLNFHKQEITMADVMVATRGVPGSFGWAPAAAMTSINLLPQYYGTEVYTHAFMFMISPGTQTWNTASYNNIYSNSNITDILKTCSMWSSFDWAPNFSVYAGAKLYRMQDLDMYAMIDNTQIKALNNCAVLSEFYSSQFPQLSNA